MANFRLGTLAHVYPDSSRLTANPYSLLPGLHAPGEGGGRATFPGRLR
jgi:hypothetical protein